MGHAPDNDQARILWDFQLKTDKLLMANQLEQE